jgi:glycosyltransferase involved in cell wall biosynthesis
MTAMGGAESVAFQTVNSLQESHDVTLITSTRPNFTELNEFYSGRVEATDIEIKRIAPIARVLNKQFPATLFRLKRSIFNRRLVAIQPDYDLMVCTHNEVGLQQPGVQYIHFPVMRDDNQNFYSQNNAARHVYDLVCRGLSRTSPNDLENQIILTNSHWTASVISRVYGVEPKVVYPPVSVEEFEPEPISNRELGFVTVGRIDEKKNILRNIHIIDKVRGSGHDVHLHIIGSIPDTSYAREVQRAVRTRDYVYIEGAVARDRLSEMLTTHRYGLHGHDYEHFGIVVAEMLGAGMLPFVPDGGGQREVVDYVEKVLYDSTHSAVEKIDAVLSSPSTEHEIRGQLPNPSERYAPEQFRDRMRSVVKNSLAK